MERCCEDHGLVTPLVALLPAIGIVHLEMNLRGQVMRVLRGGLENDSRNRTDRLHSDILAMIAQLIQLL